jgi:hypothetical protein
MPIRIACLFLLSLAQTACNPTWTKDGRPNDASMPVPPDATPPKQAEPPAGSQTPAPQR